MKEQLFDFVHTQVDLHTITTAATTTSTITTTITSTTTTLIMIFSLMADPLLLLLLLLQHQVHGLYFKNGRFSVKAVQSIIDNVLVLGGSTTTTTNTTGTITATTDQSISTTGRQ